MKGFKLQRGFIIGYAAIAVVAIATGAILANGSFLPSISADIVAGTATSGSNRCSNQSIISYEEIPLTAEMQALYPTGASRAYRITRPDAAVLEAVFNVKNANNPSSPDFLPNTSVILTGDVVFTAAPTNTSTPGQVNRPGEFRNKLVNSATSQAIREVIWDDLPDMKLGKHWIERKSYKTPSNVAKNTLGMLMYYRFSYNDNWCSITAGRLMIFGPDTGTPSPTPSATTSASGTATATGTATVTPTATQSGDNGTPTATNDFVRWRIKHGWNVVHVPQALETISATSLIKEGLMIFEFNTTGTQKWRISMPGGSANRTILQRKIGYYIWNEGPDKTVTANKVTPNANHQIGVIRMGWNLLANSHNANKKLSEIYYRTVIANHGGKCQDPNSTDCLKMKRCTDDYDNCSKFQTIKELLTGDATTKRGYGKIYVIVDESATTADKAFQVIDVTADNIDTIEIPAGKAFWFYLFK